MPHASSFHGRRHMPSAVVQPSQQRSPTYAHAAGVLQRAGEQVVGKVFFVVRIPARSTPASPSVTARRRTHNAVERCLSPTDIYKRHVHQSEIAKPRLIRQQVSANRLSRDIAVSISPMSARHGLRQHADERHQRHAVFALPERALLSSDAAKEKRQEQFHRC